MPTFIKQDLDPEAEGTVLLEKQQRLSDSILFDLSAEAYRLKGPAAWTMGYVPNYITSNTYIAQKYAEATLGFIRDCLEAPSSYRLDPSEPFYIIEVGAGIGKFAFHYIESLSRTLESLGKRAPPFVYVMTDMVEENLAYWRNHPSFQPFFEKGLLDYALYNDESAKAELHLKHSGKVLTAASVKNPIVLIANYVFDTLPQDIFYVHQGVLKEGKVSTGYRKLPHEEMPRPRVPQLLSELSVKFQFEHVQNAADVYPENPMMATIFERYKKEGSHLYFHVPVGVFRCLEFFFHLANHRFFLLAGDQGFTQMETLSTYIPFLAFYQSITFPVNYHLLSLWFQARGGLAWLPSIERKALICFAAISKGEAIDFTETAEAYKISLDTFQPAEFYSLATQACKDRELMQLEHLLLLMKLGFWDADFLPYIKEKQVRANGHTDSLRKQIIYLAEKVFTIGQRDRNTYIFLGMLLMRLDAYPAALDLFMKADALENPNKLLCGYISLCYYALQDHESGMSWYLKSQLLPY